MKRRRRDQQRQEEFKLMSGVGLLDLEIKLLNKAYYKKENRNVKTNPEELFFESHKIETRIFYLFI